MSNALPTTLVIPTTGRPSLGGLLAVLEGVDGPRPHQIVVVDDTPHGDVPDALGRPSLPPVTVLRSGGRGPAAARNLGWRRARTTWVSFLDDDVVPDPDWLVRLAADLSAADANTAAVQGVVRVPLPGAGAGPRGSGEDRRPTDWERVTAGLATSRWITADMTYRRAALAVVGGFDERFVRAYREDADLALRIIDSGGRLVTGTRGVSHPVRPAGGWVSLWQQAGNADDALMRRLHGPDWRRRAGAPRGRLRRHAAVTAAGIAAAGFALAGQWRWAGLGAATWVGGVAELAWARIAPGPRTRQEVRRMLVTSVAIPAAATWHRFAGAVRHRNAAPWRGLPDLVLFDRDGTLVYDVPYNGDPALVKPVTGVREALDRLRAAGVRLGVVTNQSGIARRLVSWDSVDAVNARVQLLLGPFDDYQVCPHPPDEGCECRKPAPGMVKRACVRLSVDPARCVVVGDTGADVDAAHAAGASGILVPNAVTRPSERAAARLVTRDISEAVDLILEGAW